MYIVQQREKCHKSISNLINWPISTEFSHAHVAPESAESGKVGVDVHRVGVAREAVQGGLVGRRLAEEGNNDVFGPLFMQGTPRLVSNVCTCR